MTTRPQGFLWKSLRVGRYGGVDVVGFKEAPRYSVLAGQTLRHFIGNFPTEEEAVAAHPDVRRDSYDSEWTGPQVSLDHLPDNEG